jgi:putative molybdopterin biosynthesis protein
LDHHLTRLGLSPDRIRGYAREEYTHLAVAVAVASARADCGLGVRAAASALNLDFVPLYQERYDLVIPREHHESPVLRPLLELLASQELRKAVANLPGYDPSPMGRTIATIP